MNASKSVSKTYPEGRITQRPQLVHRAQSYKGGGYLTYESQKSAWIAANPEATPAEYTTAMRRIADACGV